MRKYTINEVLTEENIGKVFSFGHRLEENKVKVIDKGYGAIALQLIGGGYREMQGEEAKLSNLWLIEEYILMEE